ncbi:MAG: hypothetical protein HY676_00580 [Chloroflexi bacterium]|nr:hypothetical protein [Chloroflexota bacterium]
MSIMADEVETGENQEAVAEAAMEIAPPPVPAEMEIDRLKGLLASAVSRYREVALAQAPDVPAELVSGETVEEVEASLKRARDIVTQVRERLVAREAEGRVPAGAPPRRPPDLSSLSPLEKITQGLARRS